MPLVKRMPCQSPGEGDAFNDVKTMGFVFVPFAIKVPLMISFPPWSTFIFVPGLMVNVTFSGITRFFPTIISPDHVVLEPIAPSQ